MAHAIWNFINTGIWSNLAASAVVGVLGVLWARAHFIRIHQHLHNQDAKSKLMHKHIKQLINE